MYYSIFRQCMTYSIVLLYLMTQSACISQNQNVKPQKTKIGKMEPVTLYSFKINYTVKKGQRLEFSYERNGSIGTAADYRLEDETIIEYVETEVSTPNAEDELGGHNENVTFIFEALKIGTSKIIVQEYYRLEPKEKHEFIITIE